MKQCTKCLKNKSLDLFRKDLNTKDLFSSWCKECHKVATRISTSKNRSKRIQYDKAWKNNNKEKD